jgi:hypothetical protein
MTHQRGTRRGVTDHGVTRGGVSRLLRATVASVAGFAILVSVSACGGTKGLLGIHEAPTAGATSAPLTGDHARRILTRSFTAAYLGETASGAAAAQQLRTAYTDEALRAVIGRTKLASVQPAARTSSFLAPHPRVLAVSRGAGFPRFIVAQTVATGGGVPTLHLLTSPDAATPYRISQSVEMVPPATVSAFEPLSQGSPLVNNNTGDPVGHGVAPQATKGKAGMGAPTTLLYSYAAHMAFPSPGLPNPPFARDSFSVQLREGAAGVAKAVASQATFVQAHKVLPSSLYAVRQASGDALVFGVIERSDSFVVKKGQRVNTSGNKAFVLLTGKKMVTKSASITTLEFVVFAVPRGGGKATLVAAREQVVAGSGS